MRKIIISAVICITGSFLNITFNKLSILIGFPLYLDTTLTISVTLTCGVFWGTLCGVLTNLIGFTIFGHGWEGYLFVICNAATAIITWLFMRFFSSELNLTRQISQKITKNESVKYKTVFFKSSLLDMVMDRVVVLIILSFALCFAISFLGGLITAVSGESRFTALFSATMFKGDTPVLIAEIVSRIPVNTIDRLISTFGGYAIALGLRRLKLP